MVVKLIKGIENTAFTKQGLAISAGVGDFEGHQFSNKLTLFSFVSRKKCALCFFDGYTLILNDLKCIESMICSNYCPYKDANIPHPL